MSRRTYTRRERCVLALAAALGTVVAAGAVFGWWPEWLVLPAVVVAVYLWQQVVDSSWTRYLEDRRLADAVEANRFMNHAAGLGRMAQGLLDQLYRARGDVLAALESSDPAVAVVRVAQVVETGALSGTAISKARGSE